MSIDLVQLRYFQEVARQQHITNVARELHITQPALSKNIAKLEADMGIKLFARDGKSLRLNTYGAEVLRHVDIILNEMDALMQHVSDLQSGKTGVIRIGSSFPNREPHWLLDCIRNFLDSRPNVSLKLYQMNPQKLENALLEREIDIAVNSLVFKDPNIHWEHLFTERLGVLMSINHPLAAKDIISITELSNERFLVNNSNSDVQDLTEIFCYKAGFKPDIFYEGDFPRLIAEALHAGRGISFIAEPQYRARQVHVIPEFEKKIAFRRVKEDYCVRDCGIAMLKTRYVPTVMEDFCSYLLDIFVNKASPSSPTDFDGR